VAGSPITVVCADVPEADRPAAISCCSGEVCGMRRPLAIGADRPALKQKIIDGEELLVLEHGQEPLQFRVRRDGDVLLEDVGVFVRAANPQAPQYTIMICNGITTEGSAARCTASPTVNSVGATRTT
jgi:hypothetical protein